jgi:hypothetical protein
VLDEGGLSAEPALAAELRVEPATAARPEELTARGKLVNLGRESLSLELAALSSPSLALEIVDADDVALLLPPPPTPTESVEHVTLEPGEEYAVDYNGFVPEWAKPGEYRARLRYLGRTRTDAREPTRVVSPWAEFTVAGDGSS